MFHRILASLGSTTRCLGLFLALLGLFAPAYAGPTSTAPVVEVQPVAPDDHLPLVAQVHLLAYRAHGPPSGAVLWASPRTPRVSAGAIFASYGYGYDLAGRRAGASEHRGRTLTWVYDGLGRNRLSRTSTVTDIPTVSFCYSVDDRLASDGYDANGNTVRSSQGTDAYTTEDRIRTRTRPDGAVVSIAYDGDGVKVAETVGGVTTWFLVDQQNPTGYSQTIEEVRSGAVVRSYLWGQALAPLAQTGVEGVRYFGTDGHGSVRYLTDALGSVTDTMDHDAYGIAINRTGTTDCRFGYSGYESIPSLGVHYLRARMYNADTGRFWSADKLVNNKTTLNRSGNRYVYSGGSPVAHVDPSGFVESLQMASGTISVSTMVKVGMIVGIAAIGGAVAYDAITALRTHWYSVGLAASGIYMTKIE